MSIESDLSQVTTIAIQILANGKLSYTKAIRQAIDIVKNKGDMK